ncbi:MAG TPA: SusC/RagA family TonB-linked outer membrane protein, partial [Marinilabiliaceae bacterium]|nr:SusC/RagA family TonB-linked outer membrane protein [Marinilabiliaceae bacterium]
MKKNLVFSKNVIKRIHLLCNASFSVAIIFLSIQFSLLESVSAQTSDKIVVRGTVIDDHGEPVPGVNIVPSSNPLRGTITNAEGKYLIEAYTGDILTFSFIGFQVREIPINGRNEINVALKTEITSLDEVVLVGYGTAKRANIVGSISSIEVDELEDFPVTSITSLLDGKMAGVSVNPAQPTGRPGAPTRINIRGDNTFGLAGSVPKESDPLYVVDGFIVTQQEFDLLDPSEVESFSVLKDASAAVYGARGANGVVLIQTKRGKEGKMRINYSGSYGVGDATQQTEMLSAYDQARILNVMNAETPDILFSDDELERTKNLNYDWLDDAWKLSSTTKNSITLSGGSEKVRYFAAGSHVYETGNFDNLDVTKYSYRLGLDADITKNITASVTLNIDNKIVDIPYNQSVGTNTMENLFQPLLQSPKWIPHHIDGLPVYTENSSFKGGNPFAFFDTDSYRRSQNKGNTINLMLKYQFEYIKGLEASISYSRREGHNYSKEYSVPYELYTFQAIDGGKYIYSDQLLETKTIENRNAISESYGYGQNYQLNTGLKYTKSIDLHKFDLFGTYEQTEASGNDFGATARTQTLVGVETQQGFNNEEATSKGSRNESGRLSGIGRLNYSFADRYIFEGVVRLETSTKFAPGNRSGWFPAFAAGWIISEENFFQNNIGFIDFFKFRASYGRTGTDYTGNYEYRLQYGLSNNYLFGSPQSGIAVQNDGVVASGATWEKSDKTNIGIDLKLFDSRLSISLDGFYNYNFDILETRKVEFPTSAGIEKMVSENIGRLESWGYDMEIGYKESIGKNGSWFLKGVFGFNTNRVLDRPTDLIPLDFRYPIGKSTYAEGAEQGHLVKDIIRTQEQLDAINAANIEKFGVPYTVFGKEATVGMLYYQDIGRLGNVSAGEPGIVHEADGKIDENDITYISKINDSMEWKNLLPTSVSMGGSWKGVSLSLQFNMAYGT